MTMKWLRNRFRQSAWIKARNGADLQLIHDMPGFLEVDKAVADQCYFSSKE